MGLFSEGIPFFGKKKPATAEPVQNGPTTPFSSNSMPAVEVNSAGDATVAPEASASMPAPETATVTPELTNVGTTPVTGAVETTPSPVIAENVSAPVDQIQDTGSTDPTKDSVIGMSAMSGAFPGQVIQPPQQEVSTDILTTEKPAA